MDNQPASTSQTTSLSGFGKLLKMTWQIYRSRLTTFLGIMAVIFIFGVANQILSLVSDHFKASVFIITPLYAIVLIGTLLASLWSYPALIFAVKERELKIGVKQAFQKGWPLILPSLVVSFLVGLIVMAGFLLFMIPGIIFSVWYSLALYVLVVENIRGSKALSRSKQLIKGNWWAVFLRLLPLGLVFFVIDSGFIFLDYPRSSFSSNIVSLAIQLFATPFLIIFSFLIYEELRSRKEKQN